jgi:hypothetical protein
MEELAPEELALEEHSVRFAATTEFRWPPRAPSG